MLMAEFHERFLDGERPSVALQKSQLAAAERGDNPAAWGALILSGVDEPLVAMPALVDGSAR